MYIIWTQITMTQTTYPYNPEKEPLSPIERRKRVLVNARDYALYHVQVQQPEVPVLKPTVEPVQQPEAVEKPSVLDNTSNLLTEAQRMISEAFGEGDV